MRVETEIGGRRPTLVSFAASRRLGGAAIDVSLSPDHSCTWRCVYCDVPDLVEGKGPELDLDLLATELRGALAAAAAPGGLDALPEGLRELKAVTVGGTGEPTTSFQFLPAMQAVLAAVAEAPGELDVVLQTNGTNLTHKKSREALDLLGAAGGEIWLKLDSATKSGMRATNSATELLRKVLENMRVAAATCPTWIQTCVFLRGGSPPDEKELAEYVSFLNIQVKAGVPLAGVLLYTLSHPSRQPEADELAPAPEDWMNSVAARLRDIGLETRVFA